MRMRLGFLLTAMLGLWSATASGPVSAQAAAVTVTGAAEAIFPSGASFNGVPLKGLTLGQGLVIAEDGSATGHFHAVLLGTSLLGIPQNIAVEGEIRDGSSAGTGSATFSGTATVDMGNGTPPTGGVPFWVTASATGVKLSLYTTELPTASVSAGSITIE
jgi:hypothetical protein